MSTAAIQRLTELLVADEPVLLGAAERELVRGALASLAHAERRSAHLEELLRVHGAGLERIEAAATFDHDLPGVAYDFNAATAARATFRAQLESARDAESIVSAALAFARDAAVLAS